MRVRVPPIQILLLLVVILLLFFMFAMPVLPARYLARDVASPAAAELGGAEIAPFAGDEFEPDE